ncbi:hypothetical protein GCM10023168_03310 [Fodinibacter luteus]|uniref:CAAX prenyl protease 2/Lysostaphin resistance protein A-like domain-containing protein n=1 Tax=Fodinibacter luteus TaxID=552064 RepID=A0ABP8JYC8_9MICO
MTAETIQATAPRTSYLDWTFEGRAGIVRYVVTAVLMVLVFFFVAALLGSIPTVLLQIAAPEFDHSDLGQNVQVMFTFVMAFLLLPLVVWLVHRRPGWSIGLPTRRIPFRDLGLGFGVGVAVAVLVSAVTHVTGIYEVEYVGIDWSQWLLVLAVTAPLILIQASSEEMLFRGYLTQVVRRLSSNPLLFVSIPAVLFGLPHAANIAAYRGNIAVLLPYIVSGLLYGWAAWRTGSLVLGAGLHWANNLGGEVLIGTKDDVLKSVAPWVSGLPSLTMVTVITTVNAVLTIAVLEGLLRRRATTRP